MIRSRNAFQDIIELEKCFWCLRNSAPTGELDVQSMRGLLSPPLPRAAVEGTFLAFDENRDGHIDFKELCCGLSAACRGPTTERLKCKNNHCTYNKLHVIRGLVNVRIYITV